MSTAYALDVRTAERPGGSRPSEDRIFQTDNAVIVLDGATQAFALERSGAWIANEVGRQLAAGLESKPEIDLQALLRTVIESTRREYDLSPGEAPSATVSITRYNAKTVDTLVLCDSPTFVLHRDGQVTEVRDDRLARVSSTLPRPAGIRDLTEAVWVDRIREFETFRNQPEGFWCVSASPEAADHAVIKQFELDQVEAIMMMTDGVSAIIDDYQDLPGWGEAFALAKGDPIKLVEYVHRVELEDPKALKWPRGKIHDDKAVAVITTRNLATAAPSARAAKTAR